MAAEATDIREHSGPDGPPSIGQKTVVGVAWLAADTVVAKLGRTLIQLLLAYLFVPEEFGLFALASSVVVMAELASRSGLRDILIRRRDDYDKLGGTAIWMSTSLGLVSSLVIFLLAGPAAVLFESPRVENVLRVVAVAPVINGIGVVPRARLESLFRFRAITIVSWCAVAGRATVAISLAIAGFGVYALVFAALAASAVNSLAPCFLCKPPASLRPTKAVAESLVGDMLTLFGAGLLAALVAQGDYFLLGRFADEAEVGIYYVAFTMSIQVVLVFALNLNRVMMPALSQFVDDPGRQRSAFIEASRALMLVAGPICLIQGALSSSLVAAVLPEEYAGVAMPMSSLLVGMYFRLLSFAATPLIKSQGRFRTLMVCQMLSAIWILVPAGVGAWYAGATGCAVGVAIGSMLNGLVISTVALRTGPRGVVSVGSILLPPLLLGVIAGVVALAAGGFFPATRVGAIAHLVVGGTAGCLVYAVGTRLVMPGRLRGALNRTHVIWSRVPLVRAVLRGVFPADTAPGRTR